MQGWTALLVLFAASVCLSSQFVSAAALGTPRGVKNVTFVVGNRRSCPSGTTTLTFTDGTPANLNQGVTGATRIRGCLTFTNNPQEMLRGMMVVKNNKPCLQDFYKVPTDLNTGVGRTGATRVYLCVWKATGSSASPSQVMTDMRVVTNFQSCPINMTGAALDLNDGAGGSRLTLCKSILLLPTPPPVTAAGRPACGTQDAPLSEQQRAGLGATELYLTQEVGLNLADISTFNQTVQVFYHVIHNGSAATNVNDTLLDSQTDVLNKAYQKAGFRFVRVYTNRVLNASCFASEKLHCSSGGIAPIKETFYKGDNGVLNVYLKNLTTLLGRSTFPWNVTQYECPEKGYRRQYDGIWLLYDTVPGGSNPSGYDLGATLVHEAGHWLGLYHTFAGGCSADPKGGDEVADTFPSDKDGPIRNGSSPCNLTLQSCPALVPTYKEALHYGPFDNMQNYMEYSQDSCFNQSDGFTNGQIARMQLVWRAMRQCSNYTVGTISGKGVKNCGPERWKAEAEAKCAQVAKEVSAKQNLANTVTPCACGVLDAETVVDSTNVTFIDRTYLRRNLKATFTKDFINGRSCDFRFDLTCCFSITFGGLGLVGQDVCLSNCPAGSPCKSTRVCASGVCSGGICQASSCQDEVLNGDESDIDCGGSNTECRRCGANMFCRSDEDCWPGSICSDDKVCSFCFDKVLNYGEEQVDCGGPYCAPCPNTGSPGTLGKLMPPTTLVSRIGESLAAVGPPQAAAVTVLASAYYAQPEAVAGVTFGGPSDGQIVGPLGVGHDGAGAVDLDASGKIAMLTSMYPQNDADKVGVFRLNEADSTWSLASRPARSGGWSSAYANTGRDAALSADGRTAAVYTHRGVFVLVAANGVDQAWQEQDMITHPTEEFGLSWPLALSRNVANTLLVNSGGGVLVYMRQSLSSKWSMVQNITAPVSKTPGGRSLTEHSFGESITLSDDGLVAAVGQVHWDIYNVFHSAVYIYKRQPSASKYELVTSLFSEPGAAFYAPTFGSSVALSPTGSQLLVGAPRCCDTSQSMSGPGAVLSFAFESGAWRFKVRVDPPMQGALQYFGTSVAIAGGFGFVGAPWADNGAGAVYYWQLA